MSEDKAYIVAPPTGHIGIKGSYGKCCDCGDRVFVCDSSYNAVKLQYPNISKDKIELICIKCVMKKDDVTFIPPSHEQMKEIVGVIKQEKFN